MPDESVTIDQQYLTDPEAGMPMPDWHSWILVKTKIANARLIFYMHSGVPALLRAAEASWARICKRFRIPGIDSKESVLPAYVAWAGIFKNL